jgi:lambda family phage tail tape measure protein
VQEFILVIGDIGLEGALRGLFSGFASAVRGIAEALQFATPVIRAFGAALLAVAAVRFAPWMVATVASFASFSAGLAASAAAAIAALSPFRLLVGGIAAIVIAFAQFKDSIPISAMQQAIPVIGALTAALIGLRAAATVSAAWSLFAAGVGTVAGLLRAIPGAIAAAVAAFSSLRGIAVAFGAAGTLAIRGVLTALGPIGLAISGAALAFSYLSGQTGVFGTKSATLGDIWTAVSRRISNGLSTIGSVAVSAFNTIMSAGAAVANGIIGVFQTAINAIIGGLQRLANFAISVGNLASKALGGVGNMGPLDLSVKLPEIKAPEFASNILKEAEGIAHDRVLKEYAARRQLWRAYLDQKAAADDLAASTKNLGSAHDDATGKGKKQLTMAERMKEVLKDIKGPAEEATKNIQALNNLYAAGKINATEYADQLQRMREQLLSQDQTFFGGILRGLNEVAAGYTRLGEHVQKFVVSAFGHATDAIVEFAKTGKFDFKKLIDSILEDLLRLSLNALWGQLAQGLLGGLGGGKAAAAGGGGGGGGGIGSLLGSLFGFAGGGSFTVGGQGGTDSQFVGFRATPGERVSVSTPQQQSRGNDGGGSAPAVTIPAPTLNVRVVNSLDPRASLDALATREGEKVIINMMQRNPAAFRRILGA